MLLRDALACYAEVFKKYSDDHRVEMLGSALHKADVALENAMTLIERNLNNRCHDCRVMYRAVYDIISARPRP